MVRGAAAKGRPNKIMRLLAEKYPTKESVYEQLIYLQSRLSLPKGIEHFMSDLHGEYASFFHILNNCSGVIREKVDYVFGERLSEEEKAEFCTLIYYPKEKIEQMVSVHKNTPEWYRKNLSQLLELSKLMSYKYPVSKVHGFIPKRYESVIMELMNTRPEADNAQFVYHKRLLNTIVQIDSGADFIEAFTVLIKRLAVDRLHIVGDFFDRGNRPDAILNLLMKHPSVDIQWGNHDVLWMGAALGNESCIAAVVRNSLRYNNTDVLERGYGISLRPLTTFASRSYPDANPIKAAEKAITMMMFKLEGQLIRRHPEYQMDSRLLLDKIDFRSSHAVLGDGRRYELESAYFPTIDEDTDDPYRLTEKEAAIIADLKSYFLESAVLQQHVDYLYQKGSLYTRYNGNLLFHGCVLLNEDGTMRSVSYDGQELKGRAWFDYCDRMAREAYLHHTSGAVDFMYFLWCGRLSPVSGREFKTFERALIADESTWKEPSDPYFKYINSEKTCAMVLKEFGLDPAKGHIINGHVPVKVKKGETPVKAGGKAIIIDGGFCKAYHSKTGISGYTLISNSRGLRLLQHQKIADVREALKENQDIESVSETVELQACRTTLGDTDEGKIIQDEITDLYNLLLAYQNGLIKPQE
ncbi:fructose-1,6-bisphosphatase-3 [Selenomonas ruminantium]|uniref:Fructose-1,6-bisphosphatase class 3 n=1 Tax=Selenomonas ruminantium TaxID=971 RepID=A0A1M6WCY6_SELRU|nr:fructose-1,6-bisphosphatase [Selenomonas ruminantium]SHK91551.1 fructose-1,6-bisphosphatase-3 [Selenomonas ruminantium]